MRITLKSQGLTSPNVFNGQKWRGYSLKIYLGATAGNEKKRSFSIVVYFYNISFSVINSTVKCHAKVSCCIVCDNIGCAFINKKFKDFIVMKHDEHHICDAGRVETIVETLDWV